jgi:hypothetical protein
MAKIPSVKEFGFAKLGKTNFDLNPDDINFVDDIDGQVVIANPEVAKSAIKSILLSEIGEYVKGAFNLTCNNINDMIERYNKDLLVYAEKKIEVSSQDLAEQLISRIIKGKMSKEFINDLISELEKLKDKEL